jgi:hypothetical protein
MPCPYITRLPLPRLGVEAQKLGAELTRLVRKAEDVSHGEERRGIHPKKKIVHELHG